MGTLASLCCHIAVSDTRTIREEVLTVRLLCLFVAVPNKVADKWKKYVPVNSHKMLQMQDGTELNLCGGHLTPGNVSRSEVAQSTRQIREGEGTGYRVLLLGKS